jgi:hypothetical protein
MQLLQLKRELMRSGRGDVRAVLHGDLDQIDRPPFERFPLRLFALQRVLQRPHPAGLRYLVLGRSIYDNIPESFRRALADPGIIDHPYHFPPVQPGAPNPLIVGIFGNLGEGHLLETIARRVKDANPAIRIRLIGFVSGQETVDRLRHIVEDVSDKPISHETFVERAHDISYALWIAESNNFRLRASGTFFDALAYAKPLIYNANPFIDSYFYLQPEIGTRCDTLDDVPAAILNTVANHTPERYAGAVEAMEKLRNRFSPEELAKRLPDELRF